MLELNSSSQILTIKGNEPLLLQDNQKAWYVHSGSVALFATEINEDGEAVGRRQYWFTVTPGEWILETGLRWETQEKIYGLIAIGYEDSQLEAIPLTELMSSVLQGDQSAIVAVETWIKHLNDWVKKQNLEVEVESKESVLINKVQYLSLLEQQTCYPRKEEVVWARVQQGSTVWMGLDNFTIDVNTGLFPITIEMWLQAKEPTELELVPLAEIPSATALVEGLQTLHSYLFHYLDLLETQATDFEFRRFQERRQISQQAANNAMKELSSVLTQEGVGYSQVGTPLLVAAGAVGRALGINVNPPSDSEDLYRVSNPLETIARASKFQIRRVSLLGQWWQRNQGSLLGYTQDGQPCALLREGGKYVYFDPVTLRRTPLDEAIANTLSSEAYMFYRPLPETIDRAYEILQFAVKGYVPDVVKLFAFGVIASLLGMVVPQATSILVNEAIPDGDRGILFQLGLALIVAAFAKAAFELAQGLMSLRIENAADGTLQPAAWDRLLQLQPSFFRHFATGDLLIRLMSISQIRQKLSGATQQSLLSGIFALLNLGLMLFYSVKLALVAVGITVITTGITFITSRMLVRKERKQEMIDADINSLNIELINGVAKLRVAAAEERALGAWAQLFAKRTREGAGIKRLNDSITILTEAVPLIGSVLIFWFAIVFMQQAQGGGNQALSMGAFLAFNSAYGTFLGGVTSLGNTITDILEIVPLWERAEVILKGKPEVDSSKTNPGSLTGKLHLDHLTFRYREDGPLILDDVTIEAEPGEFIALVGPSGSGKSTIFRMLLGFETPISGTVYYDGQDLAGLDIQSVRRQLGVVLQNGRISAGSIFENMSGGAIISLEQAWEAARMSGLADDIEQMPMGMHTIVSEGGTNLSGGQRQRLLIARAIVFKPNLILLDEATSALDNRTQAIVTESLDQLNATRIVVAHRLSTIRNADRIYVLKSGHIVQSGTFDELVAQEGLFARLAARQLD